MKLRYLCHSGFSLETEFLTIIFDYYEEGNVKEASIENGVVDADYIKRPGKLYVLSSHSHGDHFDKKILEWSKLRDDITYIFSEDIREVCNERPPNTFYIKKGDVYKDGSLTIEAFGSTDLGVSFMITLLADNKKIFHAGDLNNWHWREEASAQEAEGYEAAYLTELSVIAAKNGFVDIVMFPVDPRLGADYMLGAIQFLEKIKASVFAPMHFWGDYKAAAAFGPHAEKAGATFARWSKKGQTITI